MQQTDLRIDRAYETYPIAPLPPGFVRRTMQLLPTARPRFRLDFLDIALPVFLSIFLVSLAITGLWLLSLINPLWLQSLQAQLTWLAFYTADRIGNPLPLYSLALLGILGMFLLIANLLLRTPSIRLSR